MQLEKLDFYEFYKDEYSKIDRGIGIGASGLITPKQMINVINVSDDNKKELDGWAQGGHNPTYYEILKQIYNLESDIEWINTSDLAKEAFLESTLNKIIHIHYTNWNSVFSKFIRIDIPAYITKQQCEYLVILNRKIEELSKLYQIKIGVQINGYVFEPIPKEIFKEQIFEPNSKNNIIKAIKYLKKNDRINDEKSKQIYDDSLLLREQVFVPKEINKKR